MTIFLYWPPDSTEENVHVKTGSQLIRRAKPWPPRDRKVAEEMKDGLLECYQTCFKSESGKFSVDIYKW